MWVSDDGWAYLAVPHTGSTSTVAWLRKNFGVKKVGGKHSWDLPEGDWWVWTVRRDPWDRVKAMWRKQGQHSLGNFDLVYPFKEFVERLIEGTLLPKDDHRNLALLPQPEEGQFKAVVPFEGLPWSLLMLPFVNKIESFPWHNKTKGLEERVREWDGG